jgi:hypothetical protein
LIASVASGCCAGIAVVGSLSALPAAAVRCVGIPRVSSAEGCGAPCEPPAGALVPPVPLRSSPSHDSISRLGSCPRGGSPWRAPRDGSALPAGAGPRGVAEMRGAPGRAAVADALEGGLALVGAALVGAPLFGTALVGDALVGAVALGAAKRVVAASATGAPAAVGIRVVPAADGGFTRGGIGGTRPAPPGRGGPSGWPGSCGGRVSAAMGAPAPTRASSGSRKVGRLRSSGSSVSPRPSRS